MKRSSEYVRGQVSILSFVLGWVAMMQRADVERERLPHEAAPPSHWSAIQEIKALTDAIVTHIGPEDE